MEYREQLLNMIDHLVRGEGSVPEFERHYYRFYIEEVPDDALSDRDSEFFGTVHERLDWTDASPDNESRRHGWLDHEEYRHWVAQELIRYRSGQMPEPVS